jgi:enamine deaminase RidA (YjgF/YER057c/UK114 family)
VRGRRRSFDARGPWTEKWGYARAVRVGNLIEVAGTTAVQSDGAVVAAGDPYGQTAYVLEVIERALAGLGASLEDVVRTRAFLRRLDDWPEVGRRHAEVFGEIAPASSCIGGVDLMHPDLLVEIEATAVVSE